MKYKIFILIAISLPALSACAPTNYMDKNPSLLPNHKKIWGYDQAALRHNYKAKEKFLNYFQSHLTPQEYILFTYLSSSGVGVIPDTLNGSSGNILTGEARKLAIDSNKFAIFNHDGSSSIFHSATTATSRIVESGIGINNKVINMASNLAMNGDPVACRFLFVENSEYWLTDHSYLPNVTVPSSEVEKALTSCAHYGFNKYSIEKAINQYKYMKIDNKYNDFFYSKAHQQELIKDQTEKAIKECSGVSLPKRIPNSLIWNSTSNERNFYNFGGRYADLDDWKGIMYRKWIRGEVNNEVDNIMQNGIPLSMQETPIVLKDVCLEIKIDLGNS